MIDEENLDYPMEVFDKSVLRQHNNLFGFLSPSAQIEYTKPDYTGVYLLIGGITGGSVIAIVVVYLIHRSRGSKIRSYNENGGYKL